jgi:membrane fusion protein, heavy metal efflux system
MTRKRLSLVLTLFAVVGCRSGAEASKTEEKGTEKAASTPPESAHEQRKGMVHLTREQVATAGIQTAQVEKRAAAGFLRATATVEPAADRQARIGSRIPGRIVALKVGVGDRVKQGQTLGVIDSPEAGRAAADYLAALAGAQVTRGTADRERTLFEKHISAERDWREAEAAAIRARAEKEAAENRLHALGVTDSDLPRKVEGHYSSTMSLTSPLDGLVVERSATLGQMAEPSQALFVVMDLREVWLLVDVYEQDVSQVKPGQRVKVKVPAYPGGEFQGAVQNVGAIVDAKTRTVKVRVVPPNPRAELKPGMFATATFEDTVGEQRERLFAPAEAAQRDGTRTIVFVTEGENEFEPRAVRVGSQGDGWLEIVEGLSVGEIVVTRGSFALKSEMKKDEIGGEE